MAAGAAAAEEMPPGRQLWERGVVVVAICDTVAAALREGLLEILDSTRVNWPAVGSFGGVNVPRLFGEKAMHDVDQVVRDLIPLDDFCAPGDVAGIRMNCDRLCLRAPVWTADGATFFRNEIPSESAHCDVQPVSGASAIGGWANLSAPGTAPDTFVCAPGSHIWNQRKSDFGGKTGMQKIANPPDMVEISVPPNCVVLFASNIAHKICGRKSTEEDMQVAHAMDPTSQIENAKLRKFVSATFYPDFDKSPRGPPRFETKHGIRLPSGQVIPAFPNNWRLPNTKARFDAWISQWPAGTFPRNEKGILSSVQCTDEDTKAKVQLNPIYQVNKVFA